MIINGDFWFSLVTAVIAIVALIQTNRQIKLSNKQHLFDKRVEHYLIAKNLIQLYESNQSALISKKRKYLFIMGAIFVQMTNNCYLEHLQDIITQPLKTSYINNEVFIKMESIKNISAKIKFIFNGNAATLLSNFVLCYQQLLLNMYQYEQLSKTTIESSQSFGASIYEIKETICEKSYREELYNAIDNLQLAYDMLKKEKVEERIEKQIKL